MQTNLSIFNTLLIIKLYVSFSANRNSTDRRRITLHFRLSELNQKLSSLQKNKEISCVQTQVIHCKARNSEIEYFLTKVQIRLQYSKYYPMNLRLQYHNPSAKITHFVLLDGKTERIEINILCSIEQISHGVNLTPGGIQNSTFQFGIKQNRLQYSPNNSQ